MTAATTTSTTFRTWSCLVRLVVDDPRALAPARRDLTDLLARVDAAASRFRADSALSMANARPGRPTPIPRVLVDLVAAGLRAAQRTDGAVSPTTGRSLAALGYDRDIAQVADTAEPAVAVPAIDWRAVRLDRELGLLTVPHGCALDLGATAKAYTADLAARTLQRRYGTPVLVEIGGDVAVAGHRPDGWLLKVAEAAASDGQLVLVRHGGLATSTTTIRRWTRAGRPVHHIVDPRTGAPAEGPWRTVTVAAPTAFDANAASTATIVLGADGPAWLEQRRLPARLIGVDGVVHTTTGWPAVAALAGAA